MPTSATGNRRTSLPDLRRRAGGRLAGHRHAAGTLIPCAPAGLAARRPARHGLAFRRRAAEHGSAFSKRSAEHGFAFLKHSAEHGFTLVELMVVLAIIGIVSGAVVLAMPDPRGDLRHDAERFAARARAAQDKAVIEASDIGLLVSSDGYGFERRDHGRWRLLTEKPFEQRRWAQGATALVGEAGQARALFDPTGIVEPLDVTLVRDATRVRVRIGADGTIDVTG
ncbi:type II secretion system minor pseudopilin GspH [Sphingomonas solaris]|uniref:Type II secretion system protein H n=1 Tax=Alterirhizorhabdus solaris TaxID=2529389 RepID=A0A558R4D8_9SPHN|nr:type II secretion system minor pseudopilin GspH [Sphingomonas solaris]TVV74231.1 type II secretion system protein GspH [Sphingomonas solaris]